MEPKPIYELEKTCIVCGQMFKAQRDTRVFCSASCKMRDYRLRRGNCDYTLTLSASGCSRVREFFRMAGTASGPESGVLASATPPLDFDSKRWAAFKAGKLRRLTQSEIRRTIGLYPFLAQVLRLPMVDLG